MFLLGVSSEEASALLLRWLCLVQDKFCVCPCLESSAGGTRGDQQLCGGPKSAPQQQCEAVNVVSQAWQGMEVLPSKTRAPIWKQRVLGSCHPCAARGWVLAVLCCLGHLPGK